MSQRIDFLIIGSQRCGTTSLFYSLLAHPEVTGPQQKELNYFSQGVYSKSSEWYFSQLNIEDEKLVGEASPSYALLRPAEIKYLYNKYPNVKIILLTRDPIDRMWSSIKRIWTYAYMEGAKNLGKGVYTIFRYINQPSNLRFGMYYDIYKI